MTIRNIKAMIAALLLALLVCFGAVMGGQGNLSAFAATDVQTAYENTNVLDNLEGSTIGGKEFDIADYPHSDSGVPQIISPRGVLLFLLCGQAGGLRTVCLCV